MPCSQTPPSPHSAHPAVGADVSRRTPAAGYWVMNRLVCRRLSADRLFSRYGDSCLAGPDLIRTLRLYRHTHETRKLSKHSSNRPDQKYQKYPTGQFLLLPQWSTVIRFQQRKFECLVAGLLLPCWDDGSGGRLGGGWRVVGSRLIRNSSPAS